MPSSQQPRPSASTSRPDFRRRRVLVGLSAATLCTLGVLVLIRLNPDFHPRDTVAALREAGPWIFFAAMGLLPVIGFPLAPFNLAAGPAFAPSLGVPLVVALACLAISLNVSLTYWLARYTLRPLVTRSATWLGYSIPDIPSDKQLAAAFLVRATPGPPFFLQSCLLGIAGVPFKTYMIASCSIPAVFAMLCIIGGNALMTGNTRLVLLAFGGLGAVMIALKLLRPRKKI